jgi:hypothetical protein
MAGIQKDIILKKLDRIEALQKEMLKDWSLVEGFILELTSKKLKKEIRQGRKDYRSGKAVSYRQIRAALGLA